MIGRILFVNLMEIFVIVYEVGYFFNYEEYFGINGFVLGDLFKDFEFDCDVFVFIVCLVYGQCEDNIFVLYLIGLLFFFYVLKICDEVVE